jgi:flagella basal body P-ring formation protein FlgA
VLVPLDLSVSAEGAVYDVVRGATVAVVVRRGSVEVRTTGFAGADADIGDRLPVQLRPSGRVLRTRLVNKDEALVEEDGQ